MSDVTTTHVDYDNASKRWNLCEDACAGEDAIKAAGDKYLPRPNPTDRTIQNLERYKQYVARAVYYNASGRTLAGLLGLAFTEPPAVVLPPAIEFAEDDLTGGGLPLIQHAQATLAEILKTGRCGLLVDYPSVGAQVSLAQKAAGDVRATVTFYPATSIINWRTERFGGKTALTMVVLQETYEEFDDFATKRPQQYRVLRFDGSTYSVEIWRQIKSEQTQSIVWAKVDTYSPVRGDGSAWDEIPFQFVGAQNNDESVDDAPLYDIATLNVSHYRNSADYEDSVFVVGQPQFYVAGLTEEWRDHLEKSGTYLGARSVLTLPVGGSAGLLQAQPNSLAKEAMDAKEKQMAALGARVIQAATSVKTATQVDSEDAIAHSVLALACSNITSAYTQILEWFAVFENVDGDASFSLPTDFSSYTLDAQTLTALIQGVQTGNIPQSDLWARLRAAGIIAATKTDDDVREEIESQAPVGTAGLGEDPSMSDASGSGAGGDNAEQIGGGDPMSGAGGTGGDPSMQPPAVAPKQNGGASSMPDSNAAMMSAMTDCMTKMTAAIEALTTIAQAPAPVINVAPPAVTVQAAPNPPAPNITVESPNITVNVPEQAAPIVNVAPAEITVESPTVNISPPAITVESPTINVAAPVVNIEAQPPMQTTVLRGPDGRATGSRQEPIPKGKA